MNQPEDFIDKDSPNASCRLVRALDGLRQAGRVLTIYIGIDKI